MPAKHPGDATERLRRLLRAQAGIDLATLVPAGGGESGSTYLAADRAGLPSVLKLSRNAEFAALAEVTGKLRDRGYPAPRIYASGRVDGWTDGRAGGAVDGGLDGAVADGLDGAVAGPAFWLQERLAGTVAEDHAEPARLLPELLRLNAMQAGLGDGRHRLSQLLRTTLTQGGDGYCVHATLQERPDTRGLLAMLRRTADRHLGAVPERDDYVHYDFTFANLLADGSAITGVIDLNPPPLTGDRAFDLATLLFYQYDQVGFRNRLRARVLELTDERALRVYLAHMVLRQVDWSLRHHPRAPSTQHHLRLARLVAADLS